MAGAVDQVAPRGRGREAAAGINAGFPDYQSGARDQARRNRAGPRGREGGASVPALVEQRFGRGARGGAADWRSLALGFASPANSDSDLSKAWRQTFRWLLSEVRSASRFHRRRDFQIHICKPAGDKPDAHAHLQIAARPRIVGAGAGGDVEISMRCGTSESNQRKVLPPGFGKDRCRYWPGDANPSARESPISSAAARPRPKRCSTSAGTDAPPSTSARASTVAPGLIPRTG